MNYMSKNKFLIRRKKGSPLKGHFDRVNAGIAYGWAANAATPETPLTIEILVDGRAVAKGIANRFRQDVADAGVGNGYHGFEIALPALRRDSTVEARVVAQGRSGFKPDDLCLPGGPVTVIDEPRFKYVVEGFFSRDTIYGWLRDDEDPSRFFNIEVYQDEKKIACIRNDCVHEIGGIGRFFFQIPASLLDGKVRFFRFYVEEVDLEMGEWGFVMPDLSGNEEGPGTPRCLTSTIWDTDSPQAKDAAKKRRENTHGASKQSGVMALEFVLRRCEQDDVARRYELLCDIGDKLRDAQDATGAIEKYRLAIAIKNQKSRAIISLVDVLIRQGQEKEAEALVNEALGRLPDDTGLMERRDSLLAARRTKEVRIIAFYLPQFHPIPENDRWWGKGFTEWTNVASAQPLFAGHLQPRRPAALGYYDLRLPENANAQFDLARQYGIDAFCYYYYWFSGRKVLDRPLQDLVEGRSGPFPFCICWANEDWTRSWDGTSGEVLLAQDHTAESDVRFIEEVSPILRHPDYVRHDGKVVLLVYRAEKLVKPQETVKAWRDWCRTNGIGELHLCAVQSFGFDDPRPLGFDAAVEFPPHASHKKYPQLGFYSAVDKPPDLHPGFHGSLYDYAKFARAAQRRPREAYTLHRGCFLAWDNTARRGNAADVFHNFSVSEYGKWLAESCAKASIEGGGLVFLNAWNEWAEGTVLEPDATFGYDLLEATRRAKSLLQLTAARTFWRLGQPDLPFHRIASEERIVIVGHDAHPHGAQINLLNMVRSLRRTFMVTVHIFLLEGGALSSQYDRFGPTAVLGISEDWRAQLRAQLRRLAAVGVTKAICNTTVTGEAVEILRQEGYRALSLVHELPSLIENKGLTAQAWRIAGNAENIIFASQVVAREFFMRYWPNPERLLVAPQGIAFNPHSESSTEVRSEVRAELGIPEHVSLVMGCGYGDTRKGIDLFVQLASKVSATLRAEDVAFIWVGRVEDGLKPYIEADIRRLELEEQLLITGHVEDPYRYYLASDIFALTSREDPFPSVVMEAFDAGLPVVAFDGGGGYVDIVDDNSGALVPYLDVSAMASAVVDLIKDSGRRRAVAEHNRELCRSRFSYDAYLSKLLALLDGVPAWQVEKGILRRQGWAEDAPRPSISVIVPNYNYARYLELRINTVLSQTLPPDEIIVLDDASGDYSVAILRRIAEKSPIPIRIVEGTVNSGNPFAQWKKGIEMAAGELIWIAEADDYCEPRLLEMLAREFADSGVVMAWADSIMVDEAGGSDGMEYKRYYGELYGSYWYHDFRMSGSELLRRSLLVENVVPNASGVLFRKDSIGNALSQSTQYQFSGDWWFWIKVAARGNVAYCAEPLNYHRRHRQSVMGQVLRSGEQLMAETIKFYLRLLEDKQTVSLENGLQIFERLERLYGMYPDLVNEFPRLSLNPRYAADYQTLWNKLRISEEHQIHGAITRRRLVLVVSEDALKDQPTAKALVGHLLRTHELTLVVLGDALDLQWLDEFHSDEALTIRLLKQRQRAFADSLNRKVIPAGSEHALALIVHEGNEGLDDIIADQRVVTHGLLAHTLVGDLHQSLRAGWDIVAGKEFDLLLGATAPYGIDVDKIADALRLSDRAMYLDRQVPHAMARLAHLNKIPLNRLTLERYIRSRSKSSTLLRLVAVAANIPDDAWRRLRREIQVASERTKSKAVLRILAWGSDIERMRCIFPNDDGVEVLSVWERPRNIGEVGEFELSSLDKTADELSGLLVRLTGNCAEASVA